MKNAELLLCQTLRVPSALLSVFDKTGIVDFARALHQLGWDLLSSGGTAKVIEDAGIPVTDVATVTGYPAILGHRVVTLHPTIHGGLLADLDDESHQHDLTQHGIKPIALAVINLYPFASNPGIDLIDVGGPAMVRAAAKNHKHVGVITDPTQYEEVLAELQRGGALSADTRRTLAARAFAHTAHYDAQVADWFANDGDEVLPKQSRLVLERREVLRYGENPHQLGARYSIAGQSSWWDTAQQLGGKEMSYLNVFDADAAWLLVHRFDPPAAVVIKHANPCGLAVAETIDEAYRRAHECDPLSAFGGIVAVNRPLNKAVAVALAEVFTEVVIAPSFDSDALVVLQTKKNLRILQAGLPQQSHLHYRSIDGGLLVQSADQPTDDTGGWQVVSTLQPSPAHLADARIAWLTCAAVSSNAIVLVNNGQAVGIGAGQQNRVDAGRIACQRAGERALGAVAASDAFFPFRDGPDALAAAGVRVIVQPGGSQRDAETIAAANEHGMVMIFTGRRHFRH